jgi:hypothetical protein
MVLEGEVTSVETDDSGCGWAAVEVVLRVGDRVCTEGSARIAIPTTPDDNPWARRGDDWRP